MDAIREHAEYRRCRETGREASNVAWVFMYRIIVSRAGIPQSSARGNTSIFQLVIHFARSTRLHAGQRGITNENML
jgi:hypothetical protein